MIIFYFPDGEIEVPKTLLDKPRAWKVSAWQSQGQDQISNTPPRFFVDPSPSQCNYSPTIIWFQTLRSHKRGGLELSSGCGQEWQLPLTSLSSSQTKEQRPCDCISAASRSLGSPWSTIVTSLCSQWVMNRPESPATTWTWKGWWSEKPQLVSQQGPGNLTVCELQAGGPALIFGAVNCPPMESHSLPFTGSFHLILNIHPISHANY